MTIRSAAHQRGLTLVELLLSLSITAMVGLAIASMLAAVAYGTSSSKDMRSLVAINKTTNARISAAVRGSRQVLAQGDDYLVLWMVDTNEDGVPSLLEIRRIAREQPADELASYTASNTAPDTAYLLSDDFNTITKNLAGTDDFPRELWATQVTDWSVTRDDADPQKARLLSYTLSFVAGDLSDTAINTVSLRNGEEP